jgi:hypothetical protein
MEDRDDLERLLLDGLSDVEREHVREVMDGTTAAKLRCLREGGSVTSSDDEDEMPTSR